jgi:Kef-type K+ transport system membrane component KefB
LWIAIAVINNLAIVISFSLLSAIAARVFPQESPAVIHALLVNIFGSIAVGILLALLLASYIRAIGARVGLFVFMLLFVIAEAGTVVHLNTLLVGLAAGLFLENFSEVGGARITNESEPVTMPVYAIFFAVVGAEIHLHAFIEVAMLAIFAAVIRAAALYLGTALAGSFLRAPRRERLLLPLGMLPQAGIALAVATIVLTSFGPWGTVVGTLLLGSIVVNEMTGPILLGIGIAKSGEADSQPHGEPVTQVAAAQ